MNLKNNRVKAILCAVVILLSICSCQVRAAILEEYTFDDGTSLPRNHNQYCCEHSMKRVTSPVRAGTHAVRFEHRWSDSKISTGRRAEFSLYEEPARSERWYGFSTLIPNNWVDDPNEWLLVAQWHGSPDLDEGEDWRNPPLTLQISADKGKIGNNRSGSHWFIYGLYDSNHITRNRSSYGGQMALFVDPIKNDKGKWVDWVFHVKWDWSSAGFVEIWKNGKKVVDYKGPIAFNDKKGPYMKWGIYRGGSGNVATRVVYSDEVRIGDENSSFAEVSPRGSSQQTCSSSHLNLCTTQSTCTTANGNWCNNQCQSNSCAPVCSSSHLNLCTTQSICTTANGNWCNNQCQSNSCTGGTVIRADVNQDSEITTTDALLVLRKSTDYLLTSLEEMGWHTSTTTGDVNCDGEVRLNDAVLLLKKAVGGYSQGELAEMGWCE